MLLIYIGCRGLTLLTVREHLVDAIIRITTGQHVKTAGHLPQNRSIAGARRIAPRRCLRALLRRQYNLKQ
jgi:hypothetical protein